MDFEARLHTASQRLIPQLANSGYPPMVVYYHRYPPVVVDERNIPIFPIQPEPHLAQGLKWLGQIADFLVISSNGPHMLHDFIEETSGRKLLSMIDVTLEEMKRRGWKRVGVLGLGDPMVYKAPLDRMGVPYETLSGEAGGLREQLDKAILALMAGQNGLPEHTAALEAIEELRGRGVDGIILGCTEIPLLLGEAAGAPDLINPAELLAEAAVRFAME
jgi:aspartate racemase